MGKIATDLMDGVDGLQVAFVHEEAKDLVVVGIVLAATPTPFCRETINQV